MSSGDSNRVLSVTIRIDMAFEGGYVVSFLKLTDRGYEVENVTIAENTMEVWRTIEPHL